MEIIKDNTQLLMVGQSTERLSFRLVEQNDFEAWLAFCQDIPSLKYFGFSEQDDASEIGKTWFENVFNRYKNQLGGMNAMKYKHEMIGQCGLLIQMVDGIEELEISYSLLPKFRGKGFAIEAVTKCKDYAFENHLTDSLISIIHIDNKDSEKVAIKNGMYLDKTTIYKNSSVNIFRINKLVWNNQKFINENANN